MFLLVRRYAKPIIWLHGLSVNFHISSKEEGKEEIRYNQVAHLTQDTEWGSDKKQRQENITCKNAKRPALFQQMTTRLQETCIKVGQKQTQTAKISLKTSPCNGQ